jgi:hypothetical protein
MVGQRFPDFDPHSGRPHFRGRKANSTQQSFPELVRAVSLRRIYAKPGCDPATALDFNFPNSD